MSDNSGICGMANSEPVRLVTKPEGELSEVQQSMMDVLAHAREEITKGEMTGIVVLGRFKDGVVGHMGSEAMSSTQEIGELVCYIVNRALSMRTIEP